MSEFETYLASPITLTDTTLMWKNYGIMREEERVFMAPSIDEICARIHPKSVLETGFGLGITAGKFQENNIEFHTIVEAHPQVFERLSLWATGRRGVAAYFAKIQDFAPITVDLIYDDRAGLPGEPDVNWSAFNYRYYATMAVQARKKGYITTDDLGPDHGFYFDINGTKYFQRLEKNEAYRGA